MVRWQCVVWCVPCTAVVCLAIVCASARCLMPDLLVWRRTVRTLAIPCPDEIGTGTLLHRHQDTAEANLRPRFTDDRFTKQPKMSIGSATFGVLDLLKYARRAA